MAEASRRAVLAGLSISAVSLAPASAAPPKVDAPAVKFRVTTFDRKWIKLDDLQGDVVILNFWATWCAPCRVELPLLDEYARAHAGKGLRIFAVNDKETVSDRQLQPLAAMLSFPLVTKIQGTGYGPIDGAVPSNFIIDRSGVLRFAKAGAFTLGSLERLVTPLLDAPRPSSTAAPA
jgi:thiol-disulfide isomerase/thioredoxin